MLRLVAHLLLGLSASGAVAQSPRWPGYIVAAQRGSPTEPKADATPPTGVLAPGQVAQAKPALPPLPDGVTQLTFNDFFKHPVGPRGLEYSDTLRQLEGERVRILGHMVRQCAPQPGMFLLTARPYTLHEHEIGLCDDLPGATLFVFMPTAEERERFVTFTPGLLLLTGTLELGNREESDGRISTLRLPAGPTRPTGPRWAAPSRRPPPSCSASSRCRT